MPCGLTLARIQALQQHLNFIHFIDLITQGLKMPLITEYHSSLPCMYCLYSITSIRANRLSRH